MHAQRLTGATGEGFAYIKGNCFCPKHTWKSCLSLIQFTLHNTAGCAPSADIFSFTLVLFCGILISA